MPKVGMEPIRRAALVNATIAELGASRTLDITVSQIAKRAGMSSALAHHYFGGKEDIFAAAMRQILMELRSEVLDQMRAANHPRARLHAIIKGCFGPSSFDPASVTAWMLLYVLSQTSEKPARLLKIYHHRLRSHLVHALRPLSDRPRRDAEVLAALIDGMYLRASLGQGQSRDDVVREALDVTDAVVGAQL